MPRKTLDAMLTSVGMLLVVILLVAGGLLTWAHSFVSGQVRTQLQAEQIVFPARGSSALASPEIGPYLNKYAGQQMLTGQQAEAWADHYIAVHLVTIGGGKTYSQLSAAAQADPTNAALAAQVAEVFKGETLRGLLLNAYAFGKMATIAGIAAILAFVAAAVMLLLSGLGFLHLRRTSAAMLVYPQAHTHLDLRGPALDEHGSSLVRRVTTRCRRDLFKGAGDFCVSITACDR